MGRLYDGPVAFVDVETTGASPATGRVIEIGLVAAAAGKLEFEWSTLVDPGVRVPPAIQQFTGITEEMLRGAPSFARIAGEVSERLQGRLFVAHNARFDHGFLSSELRRSGRSLGARIACTVKLSRRLQPGERAHNLDALIERYALGCERRHRALPDARALWQLWRVLAERHSADTLEQTLAEVMATRSVPEHLPRELAEQLPARPGVYRFFGEGDLLLYVGKARNIRERVFAHWHAAVGNARAQQLGAQTRRVDWIETAGELGALLLEARLVRTLRPTYNRQLRGSAGVWTWLIADDGAAPLLAPLDALPLSFAHSEPFGLYRSERAARAALVSLAREHRLCLKMLGLESSSGSCFAYQLDRCAGACMGAEPLLLHNARLKLAFVAQRLEPWPFRGAIGIRERRVAEERLDTELHVIDGWRHVATLRDEGDGARLPAAAAAPFDLDVYRILRRHLRQSTGRDVIALPAHWQADGAGDGG
jgi:DNA polymerase III subunit epsilon